MVNYRRNRQEGGTYFITATFQNRRSTLLTNYVDVLRCAVRIERDRNPIEIVAFVVLPDHWHSVITLPPRDADYSGRIRRIKASFTRWIAKKGVMVPRASNGEVAVWQRRFWEHVIRGDRDLARHVDYIHYNPVKHGYVEKPVDWHIRVFIER